MTLSEYEARYNKLLDDVKNDASENVVFPSELKFEREFKSDTDAINACSSKNTCLIASTKDGVHINEITVISSGDGTASSGFTVLSHQVISVSAAISTVTKTKEVGPTFIKLFNDTFEKKRKSKEGYAKKKVEFKGYSLTAIASDMIPFTLVVSKKDKN